MTYIALRDPELARLMKARSRLGSRAPGYAAIVFGLPFVETHRTDTMATDGTSIYFNRTFVQRSTDDELLAVLFHEGLHVSLGHHLRRGNIDPTLWNVAADYAINLIVQQARLALPDGALLDEQYRGLTAEQIVRLLKQKQQPDQPDQPEQPQPPQGGDDGEGEGQGGSGASDDTDDDQDQDDDGQGQGGDDADDGEDDDDQSQGQGGDKRETGGFPGEPADFEHPGEIWDAVDDEGERLSGDDLAQAEETLRRDVIVAAAAEKAAGSGTITLDGGVVEAAKAATVDWVEALGDFLNRAYAGEPTLAKPARRHLWEGNYFPSMQGVGGGDLVIAIDTSGSVSQEEAEQFASEIDSIREMIKPDRTCVIYCDTKIQKSRDGQSYDVFDSYEDIEVRAIRGKGTRFDPPFHLVDQEGLEPHAFIYFTDGLATVKERTADVVDYPVLWATTGREPAFEGQEFGEVITLTI
jgi:predicted metal-dependent peptidase